MATQQPRSFFERLTGARVLDTEDAGLPGERDIAYQVEDDVEPVTDEELDQVDNEAEYEDEDSYAEEAVADDEQEGQLTVDVFQDDQNIIIQSTIAGVSPDDLDISITNDMVTVRGERRPQFEVDPEDYFYQECYWGPFSRSIILPVEIDADRADAKIKNGILTIRIPKANTAVTRKLKVKAS